MCAFRKATGFQFESFPTWSRVQASVDVRWEMGKGNDGLEGKLRQRAASRFGGGGKNRAVAQGLPAVSYCCHSLGSFVVKMVAAE